MSEMRDVYHKNGNGNGSKPERQLQLVDNEFLVVKHAEQQVAYDPNPGVANLATAIINSEGHPMLLQAQIDEAA